MFRLIWAASVRTHSILSYAPTNLLIAAIRTRRGLKWGPLAMLLAIPYWFIVSWCVTTIEDGGPHWLNAVVLLAAWNLMKFVIVGPVSLILLVATRMREWSTRRRRDVDHRVQDPTCIPTRAGGELKSTEDLMSAVPTTLGWGAVSRNPHRRGPQRGPTAVDTLRHNREVIEHPKEPRQ